MEVHKGALLADSSVLTSMTSHDLYLKAIKEMHHDVVIGWLSSNMSFHKDWAKTRAVAALKACMTVNSMISDKKLVDDDRTSLFDDNDSVASIASYMKKKPKRENLDDKNQKFFTCLPTCYAIIFAFDSKDAAESYCPFACHDKCWQQKNSLGSILDG